MKKIVLILDSLDKMFTQTGSVRGGANYIGKCLVEYFSSLNNVVLDIICEQSTIPKPGNVNNVYVLNLSSLSENPAFFDEAKKIVEQNDYDVVLSSDLLTPFGDVLMHSHTVMYKNKNCRNIFESLFQSFQRRKRVNFFKERFINKDRKVFTVSKKLKNDYVKNLMFDKDNVVCVYPGVIQKDEIIKKPLEVFTFGIIAGSSANKGALLFISAMWFLKFFNKKFKAKMVINQKNKTNIFLNLVNLLKLSDVVDAIINPNDLDDFYTNIDCLVLPSINEAFGLVVTEAAINSRFSLVSNTTGASEIITDGKDGFIFKRTSSSILSLINITKKMMQILNLSQDEIKEISHASYILATKYTWDNFLNKIAKSLKLN